MGAKSRSATASLGPEGRIRTAPVQGAPPVHGAAFGRPRRTEIGLRARRTAPPSPSPSPGRPRPIEPLHTIWDEGVMFAIGTGQSSLLSETMTPGVMAARVPWPRCVA